MNALLLQLSSAYVIMHKTVNIIKYKCQQNIINVNSTTNSVVNYSSVNKYMHILINLLNIQHINFCRIITNVRKNQRKNQHRKLITGTCVSFLYGLIKSGSFSITPSSCAICSIILQMCNQCSQLVICLQTLPVTTVN